jgi:hypothetical protein
MALPVDPWLRALRAFVIIAGIAIVVGVGIVIWAVTQRSKPGAPAPTAIVQVPTAAAPAAAPQPAAPVIADLHLPHGAAIIDMRLQNDRIVLLLRGADDQDYLAVVDAATGERRMLLRAVPDAQ